MSAPAATGPRRAQRHLELLVAPAVTFAVVVGLLVAARHYDSLPVKPPACGFRNATGLPCLSCGGTRSMKALSRLEIAEATRTNPAVVVGVACSAAWLALAGLRFLRGDEPAPPAVQTRRIKRVTLVVAVLLSANWIYLLFHLE